MPEKLKYPIGQANIPENISKNDIQRWITTIEEHPRKLFALVNVLTEEQLDTAYRPVGWTIRQVVHHLGDSHTNNLSLT